MAYFVLYLIKCKNSNIFAYKMQSEENFIGRILVQITPRCTQTNIDNNCIIKHISVHIKESHYTQVNYCIKVICLLYCIR